MAAPCVLISSCHSASTPDYLVKEILGVTELPSPLNVVTGEEIQAYSWHVDTKYYTADIHICTSAERTIGNEEFAESVNAIVLMFDTKQSSSLDQANMWLPYLKQLDPPVRLLVCETCAQGDEISRLSAQHWCLDNGFELVELNPEAASDDDDIEDEFMETVGVERIVQALKSHMWPNLTMKENPGFRSAYINKLMEEEASKKCSAEDNQDNNECDTPLVDSVHNEEQTAKSQSSVHNEEQTAKSQSSISKNSELSTDKPNVEGNSTKCECNGAESDKKTVPEDSSQPRNSSQEVHSAPNTPANTQRSDDKLNSLLGADNMQILTALSSGDSEHDSFEQLFSKLSVMKDQMSTMGADQRRQMAEQMVVQFWRAIGGDEDEIEGLDDSD